MGRAHPVRDAGLAVSLLTVIPTPSRWPEDGRTQVAAWFPAVGLVLGSIGYGVVKLGEHLGFVARAPYVVAVIVVILWALTTRLLHWDGLADVADGYWGSHDQQRRLDIMADSHTGAFGATAVALVAVLEVTALGVLVSSHELPVLLVPVFGRFAATAAAWLGSPARAGGLGRSVIGRPTVLAIGVAALVLCLASILFWLGFGLAGLALAASGIVLGLAVPHLLSMRFGGVTGDVMGASVLITETVLFTVVALVV